MIISHPIRLLLFTLPLMAGCALVRTVTTGPMCVIQLDSVEVTANGTDSLEQRGNAPARLLEQKPDSEGGMWRVHFAMPRQDAAGPMVGEFRREMDDFIATRKTSDLAQRARNLLALQVVMRRITEKSPPSEVRDAAQCNLVAIAAALGDEAGWKTAVAGLPDIQDSQISRFAREKLADDATISLTQHVARLRAEADNARVPPKTGTVLERNERREVVTRMVTPARPARFDFTEATPPTLNIGTVEVLAKLLCGSDGSTRAGISITNKSDRTMTIGALPARIIHGGRKYTLSSTVGILRLLPGDRETVWFRLDTGADVGLEGQNLATLFAEQAVDQPSSFSVFDLPVAVDALGQITRKENPFWNFTFVPMAPEKTEIDDEHSLTIVTNRIYVRGLDRLLSTH